MKSTFLLLAICIVQDAISQDVSAFKPLRFDEDYSGLKTDSNSNWYEKTKRQPFGESLNTYISLVET